MWSPEEPSIYGKAEEAAREQRSASAERSDVEMASGSASRSSRARSRDRTTPRWHCADTATDRRLVRLRSPQITTRPHIPDEARARECGLRLLELSETYARVALRAEAEPQVLTLIGLVARQRRLLRAIYALADADMHLEAGILARTMLEYLIVLRWLRVNPRLHHAMWVKHDLEARLRIDREIREVAAAAQAEPPAALAAESRDFYENALRQARHQVEKERVALGLEKAPRYPTLKEQATAAGLAMAYARLYRIESQSGAHPMVMAIDELLEEGDGALVLSEPRSNPRSYGTAAIALMESLQLAKRLLPELSLDGLDEVSDEICALVRPHVDESLDPLRP